MINHEDARIFCTGYYSEILVMDTLTLDILFTLTSRVEPNWISSMHVIRPPKRQGNYLNNILKNYIHAYFL